VVLKVNVQVMGSWVQQRQQGQAQPPILEGWVMESQVMVKVTVSE
jgi:hypothetical protein